MIILNLRSGKGNYLFIPLDWLGHHATAIMECQRKLFWLHCLRVYNVFWLVDFPQTSVIVMRQFAAFGVNELLPLGMMMLCDASIQVLDRT